MTAGPNTCRPCVCVQPARRDCTRPATAGDGTARQRRECENTHGGKPAGHYTTLHYTYTYSNSTVAKHPPNVTLRHILRVVGGGPSG